MTVTNMNSVNWGLSESQYSVDVVQTPSGLEVKTETTGKNPRPLPASWEQSHGFMRVAVSLGRPSALPPAGFHLSLQTPCHPISHLIYLSKRHISIGVPDILMTWNRGRGLFYFLLYCSSEQEGSQ